MLYKNIDTGRSSGLLFCCQEQASRVNPTSGLAPQAALP
jgi:hypothetical protein